jgi:class 3 adenylate cyclase
VAERRLVSILFADLGGFTTGQEVGARDLLERARATFERLRATPWLERADRVRLAEAAAGV